MSDKVVSLKIKVTDDGSFHTVEVNAEELRDAMRDVQEEIKNLNSELLNWNQAVQAVESVQQSIGQLYSTFSELSAAYAIQETNEAKLANVMRNTMGATEADVDAIKRLCSAQQELGVIGDEVQLAGAQELATYLEERKSLEQLIPVMNDMIAQQYGLEASGESAAQIATMLGKVMQGQTEALSRYGYGFNEAQKEILQTGTEAERAAVLMDVITESVGGTNEALAQTDSGKLQQAVNVMGDMKEAAGAIVQPIMAYVAAFNQVGMGIVNLTKLIGSYKAVREAILSVVVAEKKRIAAIAAGTLATDKATIADKAMMAVRTMMIRVTGAATVSTRALTLATVGLTAGLTMGLSVAIYGVTTLISQLCSKSDEAAQKTDNLKAAETAYTNEAVRVKSEMSSEISKLSELIKAKEDTTAAVKELNDKYGDIFGTYDTASQWLDILTAKQETYAQQLAYTAKAMQLQKDIAEKQVQIDLNKDKMAEMEKDGTAYRKVVNLGTSYSAPGNSKAQTTLTETMDYLDLIDKNKELEQGIEETNKVLEKTQEHINSLKESSKNINLPTTTEQQTATTQPTAPTTTTPKEEVQRLDGSQLVENANTFNELGNNVRYYQNALDNTEKSDTAEIQRLVELRDAAKDAQAEIEKLYGTFGKQPEAEAAPANIEQLNTEKELADAIDYYNEKRRNADAAERASITKTIEALERKQNTLRSVDLVPQSQQEMADLGKLSGKKLQLKLELIGVDGIESKIREIDDLLENAGDALTEDQRKDLRKTRAEWKRYEKELKRSKVTLQSVWSPIEGIGSAVTNMTDTLKGNGKAWSKVCAVIDGMISIYNGFDQIIKIIGLFTAGSNAATTAKTAEGTASGVAAGVEAAAAATSAATTIPAVAAETSAYQALAAAKLSAAYAAIPFAGPGLAADFIAAMLAEVQMAAAIPAFADGGIAYGPTLGIFGEYAGASTNPEVVAPLDKLKSLIGEGGGGMSGNVTFHIHRRELVGVLQSAERYNSRIK
jgi:hypothetical protein